MSSKATFVYTLALVFLAIPSVVDASWRMAADVLVTARVDPLIAPGRVSGHVHDVVGPSNFDLTYDQGSLMASQCTTTEIQADKSAYWAPAVYQQRNGQFQLLRSRYIIYYLHRGQNQRAFPPGFRMIAGSANKNTITPGRAADEAINFHCLGGGNQETLDFPRNRCDSVRVQILFPSCWDGRNTGSGNFQDHVAYPTDGKEGSNCPASHPVRLMTLFLEHIIDSADGRGIDPNTLVLSNGDRVGWSSHADFLNGWDEGVLQQAINQCTDPLANLDRCPVLTATRSSNHGNCRPRNALPLEDVGFYGPIQRLLGDNPVWGGGQAKNLYGSSNTPPLVPPYSVLPGGWDEHGCISEGRPYSNTMNGDHIERDNMSPLVCISHCNGRGFSLAGLDGARGCFCANSLENGGTMNIVAGQCNSICSGSRYELCGGARHLRLYRKTRDGPASDNLSYPAAGAQLSQVYTEGGSGSNAPNPSNPPQPAPAAPAAPPICRRRPRVKRSTSKRATIAERAAEPLPVPHPAPIAATHLARHYKHRHLHMSH